MRLLFLLLVSAATVLPQTGAGGGGASSRFGTSAPRVVKKTEPEYTKEALDARLEGSVILSLTVDVDGNAHDIQIVKGLGMGLDEKAVQCLEAWRFTPGTRQGEAVPTKASVAIRFKLPTSD